MVFPNISHISCWDKFLKCVQKISWLKSTYLTRKRSWIFLRWYQIHRFSSFRWVFFYFIPKLWINNLWLLFQCFHIIIWYNLYIIYIQEKIQQNQIIKSSSIKNNFFRLPTYQMKLENRELPIFRASFFNSHASGW